MEQREILSLLLPEGLLEYFDVIQVEKTSEFNAIHLEEKNIVPVQYKDSKLVSKGFYEPVTIHDFPLRGKACYLMVKRRRWTNLDTGDIVVRDWEIVAKGTRMTAEFAAFLKAINR